MSAEANVLVIVSMLGLVAILGLWAVKTREWRLLVALIIATSGFAILLHQVLGFPKTPMVAMGARGDLVLWVALYMCMITGMFAQFAYRYFDILIARAAREHNALAPLRFADLCFADSLRPAGNVVY
jgi:hypothetical protein